MEWYPFYATDFRRKTYHLCAAARGIYRELIDEYMLTGKPLPDHDSVLAGIARVSAHEWGEHQEVVRAFFKSKDGYLFHKRCEQELHAQRMRSARRSKSAKEAATVRWAKEKGSQQLKYDSHADRNANAMRLPATNTLVRSTLTSSEVGERQRTPQRQAQAEMLAELLGGARPQTTPSPVETPQASEKTLMASPELTNSLKRAGAI